MTQTTGPHVAATVVAATVPDAYPRIVATLIRQTRDWTVAEDAAQEALALALQRWPADGVPANPGGWLMTAARHRAIDMLRRASVEQRKLHELAVLAADPIQPEPAAGQEIVDDRLRLIFTCCHPALSLEARVALTLRTVCGVPTAEIAQVLLVSESTMTRRLTRAKTKIAMAKIPYRVPEGPALGERLPGVLAVLYLLFTQGYNADGDPAFADEAIRLARLLAQLMPDQPEVGALLALFLLQHSRRAARRDRDGNLIPLPEQDRSRWTTRRSPKASTCSPPTSPGPTPYRHALQPATPPPHPRRPPTGQPSRPVTTGSPKCSPHPSSNSTGP